MKNRIAIPALLGIALVLSLSARGESLTPPDMPSAYRAECGSCHVPFPPNLLSAGGLFSGGGWRTIMDDLRTHFGENAALEEALHRQIEQYLVNHAGGERRFGSRTDPPRLTTTTWFRRNHGEMKAYFADSRGGGAANCPACHRQAERGHYAKEDLVLPYPPPRHQDLSRR